MVINGLVTVLAGLLQLEWQVATTAIKLLLLVLIRTKNHKTTKTDVVSASPVVLADAVNFYLLTICFVTFGSILVQKLKR